MLRRLIDDYHVTAFVGVMFVLLGLCSAYRGVIEDLFGAEVQLPYFMLFFGIVNLMMTAVFVVLGARSIEGAIDEAHAQHKINCLTEICRRLDRLESQAGIESTVTQPPQVRNERTAVTDA